MWINVNSELPSDGELVLIFVPKAPDARHWHKDKYYVACYYSDEDTWFIDDDNYQEVSSVSYWQRLSPPGVDKVTLDKLCDCGRELIIRPECPICDNDE